MHHPSQVVTILHHLFSKVHDLSISRLYQKISRDTDRYTVTKYQILVLQSPRSSSLSISSPNRRVSRALAHLQGPTNAADGPVTCPKLSTDPDRACDRDGNLTFLIYSRFDLVIPTTTCHQLFVRLQRQTPPRTLFSVDPYSPRSIP